MDLLNKRMDLPNVILKSKNKISYDVTYVMQKMHGVCNFFNIFFVSLHSNSM